MFFGHKRKSILDSLAGNSFTPSNPNQAVTKKSSEDLDDEDEKIIEERTPEPEKEKPVVSHKTKSISRTRSQIKFLNLPEGEKDGEDGSLINIVVPNDHHQVIRTSKSTPHLLAPPYSHKESIQEKTEDSDRDTKVLVLPPTRFPSPNLSATTSKDSWMTSPFERPADMGRIEDFEPPSLHNTVTANDVKFSGLPIGRLPLPPDLEAQDIMLGLGHPSEEWVSNIEKLFLHFFLVMFDTESESSRVMLQMFPFESSQKVEGTFRILYKMDAELYKDLEHVVYLAQNWILSPAIKGPAQERGLQIINNYMEQTKIEGYELLPTEERLNNLKTFIQSLENIGDLPKRQLSTHNIFRRETYGAEANEQIIIKRPKSPRVKPASHYARVVANILCDRPCGKPVTPPDVYADKMAKRYLGSQFITEKELLAYTNVAYGSGFTHRDVFHQINPNLYRKRLNPSHIDPINRNCMLPIYTAAYHKKIKTGTCCPRRMRRSGRKSTVDYPDGFFSPRGHYHRYKILSDSSEEWEHDFKTGTRTKRKRGYKRGKYGGYIASGMKNYYEDENRKSRVAEVEAERWAHVHDYYAGNQHGSYINRKLRNIDSDSDSDNWEHDRKGRRTIRMADRTGNYKSVRRLRNVDSDPDSGGWEHDKWGRRTSRKKNPRNPRRKIRDIDTDSDSDGWEHDNRGRRTSRKTNQRNPKRKIRGIDTDSDSDGWKHDNRGRRVSRKPNYHPKRQTKAKQKHSLDSDPDSGNWEHDNKGRRTTRKPYRYPKKKLRRNVGSDDSGDFDEDSRGRKFSRKYQNHNPQSNYKRKQKPLRNYDSDPDSDNWEHDPKSGKRTERKEDPNNITRYSHKKLRNIDSDSDSDAWEHNKAGKRTKRKPNVDKYSYYGHKPHKRNGNENSDSNSDDWHYTGGKKQKSKYGYKGKRKSRAQWVPSGPGQGYKHGRSNSTRATIKKKHFDYPIEPQRRVKDMKSDSDSDAWNHDDKGHRTKRKAGYKPRKSIKSDSDSDAWVHNDQGKRVKRVPHYKPRKHIASDSDSDAWDHDHHGRRLKRVNGYAPRKSINSDPDSDNWLHDKMGKRQARIPTHHHPGKGQGHGTTGYSSRPGVHRRSSKKHSHSRHRGHEHDMHNLNNRHHSHSQRGHHSKSHHSKHNRKGKHDDNTLPHLGDGDQQNNQDHDKAGSKKSVVTLPLLVPKPDNPPPQITFLKKSAKGNKSQTTQQSQATVRSYNQDPKQVSLMDNLHSGYRKESLDSIEGSFPNFVPRFLDDEIDGEHSSSEEDAMHKEEAGDGDPGINTCWELSEILFKSPYNKSLIPAPENILNYIERTIPKARWPKGAPVATRKYPNGALFCSMYENGSGLIFYPHGGLAVVISAPRPFNRVLVIRDPLDGFFFMDKAVMAQLSTVGHGSIYDQNGTLHTQYNVLGGFHLQGAVDQSSQRWLWNRGGIRLILKLNKYIRVHVSNLDKIRLDFNGHKRGVNLNVGAGRKVTLIKVVGKEEEIIPPKGRPRLKNPDSTRTEPRTETALTLTSLGTPQPGTAMTDYSYLDKKFSTPVLGFVDKDYDEA